MNYRQRGSPQAPTGGWGVTNNLGVLSSESSDLYNHQSYCQIGLVGLREPSNSDGAMRLP